MKSYSIVGSSHTQSEGKLSQLAVGTEARLIREPANKFDPNAIMVWVGADHVGYVPRKQNAALAARIDRDGEEISVSLPMAQDGALSTVAEPRKSIPAKFVRSPNSGFPMVQVSE